MSLSITSYPQSVVDSNSSKISKWSAVHHSVDFGMQREDYSVTASISANSLELDINLQGYTGTLATDIPVGQSVYLKTANGSGTFVVTAYIGGSTIVVTRGTFTAYGVGFTNFLSRLNYFVETKVWGVNSANAYYLIGSSVNKPNSTGALAVDVSSFLKSAVGYLNSFDYNVINKKELPQGGSFNVSYSENWQGNVGTFSTISQTVLRFFVNAAKQIQDLYGSNMGEYVPFYLSPEPAGDVKANFLSDFNKPTYFPNFPFDLSFIYSESLVGITTERKEETFNINGGTVSTSTAELFNAESQAVNRLMIEESYASGIDEIDVWLESDGTINCVKYVAEDYVLGGYVEEVCGLPLVAEDAQVLAEF
jgi:hypothetical protein